MSRRSFSLKMLQVAGTPKAIGVWNVRAECQALDMAPEPACHQKGNIKNRARDRVLLNRNQNRFHDTSQWPSRQV